MYEKQLESLNETLSSLQFDGKIGHRTDGSNRTALQSRAAIYVRKSHFTEGKSKSIEDQIKDGRRVCEKLGLIVSEIYNEGEGCKGDHYWAGSGRPGPERPELGRLMRDMEAGKFGVVVVWKSDRLYRDCGLADAVLKAMRAHNVALVCGGSDYSIHTATGFARASLEAVSNREQRDKASEDVKRALGERSAEGQLTRSPACLGFRSAGRYSKSAIAVPDEISLVRRMFNMFLVGEDERGPLGVTAIATQFIREGTILPRMRKRDGNPTLTIHTAGRIRRILSHVAYIGKMRNDGEDYDCDEFLIAADDGSGRTETVIPLGVWQAAQEKLERQTKFDKKSEGLGTPHLLTGIACCGYCGHTVYVQTRSVLGKGGVTRVSRRFICNHLDLDRHCPKGSMPTISEEVLEGWIIQQLAPILMREIADRQSSSGRNTDIQMLAELKHRIDLACKFEAQEIAAKIRYLDDIQMEALAVTLRTERESLVRKARDIEERIIKSNVVSFDFAPEELPEMPRATIRSALQSAIEWIALCPRGVIALTRLGTYVCATFRKGDPSRGEHPNLKALNEPNVVDSLSLGAWFANTDEFVKGRRKVLGKRASGLMDDDLLPGIHGVDEKILTVEQGIYIPDSNISTELLAGMEEGNAIVQEVA